MTPLTFCRFLLHGTSGPYLSPFLAHAHITIACTRYLLTCTEFTTSALSPTPYAHIVKGCHDIFPYVQEFWLEHLAKCVHTKEGKDDTVCKSVLEQLDRLSTAFARSTTEMTHAPDKPARSVATSPAEQFPTLLPVVQRYMDFRKSTPAKMTPTRTESQSTSVESDPTTLTETYSRFREAFESLVNGTAPFSHVEMDIDMADLDQFNRRHRSTAYCCRWTGCIWASTGFQTSQQRADHEMSHRKQFRCSDSTCDFAHNGFASRDALRRHTLKYHSKEEDLVLPEFPLRRPRDEPTETTKNKMPNSKPDRKKSDFLEPTEELHLPPLSEAFGPEPTEELHLPPLSEAFDLKPTEEWNFPPPFFKRFDLEPTEEHSSTAAGRNPNATTRATPQTTTIPASEPPRNAISAEVSQTLAELAQLQPRALTQPANIVLD